MWWNGPRLTTQVNAGDFAAAGLAAVLLVLPSLAIWGALETYFVGYDTARAAELSDAYEQARYSVASEESLERKYRLEPTPLVRRLHHDAAASLVEALERARTLSHGADATLVNEVLAQHATYLAAIQRMFAAIDAGNPALTNVIDHTEADPAFDAIETRVDQSAAKRRAEAATHLQILAGVQSKVLIATPIVLVLGFGLLAFFWSVVRGYRQRATETAFREADSARRSERRFRSLVQNSSDVILTCDVDGRIVYQTPVGTIDWGFASDALINQPLEELFHPEDRAAARELWQQALNLPETNRTTELRLHDQGHAWHHVELILINLLDDISVEGVVATIRNITARKEFEQQLTHQAFYDSLTHLPNRALFQDRLVQAMDRASRRQSQIGLLFVDLDNFKLVNDSLGHRSGDEVLAEAARRLQTCVRAEDTVARLGGDEFIILLHQLNGEPDAALVAERVGAQFARPFTLRGHDVVVTASVGIALGASGHEAADCLVRNADLAMYRAKIAGKGKYVVFDNSMHTDALARLQLESDLRRAFDQDEFRVHYQPIVSLQSDRIVGAEALVRWQHPTRGLVAPSEFIPLAEETGLISQLGQWVLDEACRQTAAWHAKYPTSPPLTIAVNLSPRQFQHPNLIQEISSTLQEVGLAPTSLKLEITEGVVMRDAEATIVMLQNLKRLGVQIAIDDFGTGYSSLAYLKRLPLDVLKIDRSFVRGMGEIAEDTAIVRAIITLAHSLNLTITAEGIETERQARLMQAWNCERGQGYYWSGPVDAATFGRLLEHGRCIRTRDFQVA